MMEYQADFESSNVKRIGYEGSTQMLEVLFHNGGAYNYFDVPDRLWEDFKKATSKGKFLQQYIKGHYRYSKV